MKETVYETKHSSGKPDRLYQLPKNRKQVGQPQLAVPEVFIEDYAWLFGRRLSEQDFTECMAGVLLGESVTMESGRKIIIRALLWAEGAYRNDNVVFDEEIWSRIYREIAENFPGQEVVGWYLGGPGFLLEAEEKLRKVHVDSFGGHDKVLFKIDSIEKEEAFFAYRDGRLTELPGYSVYYEKNEEMQNYMMKIFPKEEGEEELLQEEGSQTEGTAVKRTVLKGETSGGTASKRTVSKREISDGASAKGMTFNRMTSNRTTSKRMAVKGKKGSLYRLFYAAGGMAACLAIIVICSLTVQLKEREELRTLLNRQDGASGGTGTSEAGNSEDAVQANTGVHNGNLQGLFRSTPTPVPKLSDGAAKPSGSTEGDSSGSGGTGETSGNAGGSPSGSGGMAGNSGGGEGSSGTGGAAGISDGAEPTKADENHASDTSKPSPAPTSGTAQTMGGQWEYMVQPGDTLASICMQFYGSVEIMEEILRINGLEDRDKIFAGQTLRLP